MAAFSATDDDGAAAQSKPESRSSPNPLPALLTSLTTSLLSTLESLPRKPDYLPRPNSISLLDLKNEVMLSYLHNIVHLVLVRLRGAREGEKADIANCVKQLVELRVMLEKGVKPVETKLRYQIDKVVRRSVEAEIASQTTVKGAGDGDEDGSEIEDKGGDVDDDATKRGGGIRVNTTLDADGQPVRPKFTLPITTTTSLAEDLSYRPHPAALTKATPGARNPDTTAASDGIYRPPHISAVSMTTTTITGPVIPTARAATRRSYALDSFVTEELSSAPAVEPSIGSTIVASGRSIRTAEARREEAERREYEESNFVRLPKLSKKDAAQKRKRDARVSAHAFGGEDWRSFAGDLDRLTARASRTPRVATLLEKSRKRKNPEEDGDAGVRVQLGKRFKKLVGREKKRKT